MLVAVDIGNSRLKAAKFGDDLRAASEERTLPEPLSTFQMPVEDARGFDSLLRWLGPVPKDRVAGIVASVNPLVQGDLERCLRQAGFSAVYVINRPDPLPLEIPLPNPEAVGIDRLLNAVAVNVIRPVGQPVIVVDAGSAVTVDAISPQGEFLGGAILPGIGMGSRALNHFTYGLPLVDLQTVDPEAQGVPALGKATPDAIRSGLFWGAVGAIAELVRQLVRELRWTDPMLVLTGGDGPLLCGRLPYPNHHLPELTLQGMALVAAEWSAGDSGQ